MSDDETLDPAANPAYAAEPASARESKKSKKKLEFKFKVEVEDDVYRMTYYNRGVRFKKITGDGHHQHVKIHPDGRLECSCAGFYHNNYCRHVEGIEALQEMLRVRPAKGS